MNDFPQFLMYITCRNYIKSKTISKALQIFQVGSRPSTSCWLMCQQLFSNTKRTFDCFTPIFMLADLMSLVKVHIIWGGHKNL